MIFTKINRNIAIAEFLKNFKWRESVGNKGHQASWQGHNMALAGTAGMNPLKHDDASMEVGVSQHKITHRKSEEPQGKSNRICYTTVFAVMVLWCDSVWRWPWGQRSQPPTSPTCLCVSHLCNMCAGLLVRPWLVGWLRVMYGSACLGICQHISVYGTFTLRKWSTAYASRSILQCSGLPWNSWFPRIGT